MSRVLMLSMDANDVIIRCNSEEVGISAIENLPAGGVRLVCRSTYGAHLLRGKLKSKLIKETVVRAGFRPRSPLW